MVRLIATFLTVLSYLATNGAIAAEVASCAASHAVNEGTGAGADYLD